MKQDYDFGEFLPDQPSYKNPGLLRAENVFAVGVGYAPILSPVGTGQVVSGEIRGAARFDLPDGTPLLIVGTTADLFVIRGTTVYASGLGLSLAFGDYWCFDQMHHSIYAMCRSHGMHRLVSLFSNNTFVASPGTPPKATAMDVVGDFMMVGNLAEVSGDEEPYRVRWSSFNNPIAAWDEDIARQSGWVDMPSQFGEVTAIVGGKFDLVFQRNAISRIWYTGGPTVFAKEVIEDERGCPAPQSIVRVGNSIYFLAHDGFCRTDGSGVEVLSSDKIWQWFRENSNLARFKFVQGAVDWSNRSIVWSFSSKSTDALNTQLIYSWATQRWTTAEIDIDWVIEGTTVPVGLDDTDPMVAGDDLLDAEGPSFDSPEYEAQGRVLSCFINGERCEFLGPALAATFETAALQPQPGNRSFIRGVFPLFDTQDRSISVSIAGQDWLGDAVNFGQEEGQGPLGFCPVVSDAVFHRVQLFVPAGEIWSKGQGFQIDWEVSGEA